MRGNPEVKRWDNGQVIIPAGKYSSLKEAVEKEYKNLSRADLSRANLSGANLSRADLSGADLSRAKIWGEVIKKQPIQISGLGWWITITEKHIQIGCEVHKAEEWFEFKDSRIKLMHEDALDWWKKHKKFIKSAWELHRED